MLAKAKAKAKAAARYYAGQECRRGGIASLRQPFSRELAQSSRLAEDLRVIDGGPERDEVHSY